MLGEHLARAEQPARLERALGDDPLALAEQIGEDAAVGDRHAGGTVGHGETYLTAGQPLDRARLDETAQAEPLARLERVRRQIGRRHEQGHFLAECRQHERRRAGTEQQHERHEHEPLPLAQAHGSASVRSAVGRGARRPPRRYDRARRSSPVRTPFGPQPLGLGRALARAMPALPEQGREHAEGGAVGRPHIGPIATHRQELVHRLRPDPKFERRHVQRIAAEVRQTRMGRVRPAGTSRARAAGG